jgi:hypothetical protein
MKKLMMAMLIGLALAATGFAQERGGFAGHSDRAVNGHFSGQAARGGHDVQGFASHRDFRARTAFGLGFSNNQALGYSADGPAYIAPVGGRLVAERRFERGRRCDRHRWHRRHYRR